MDDPDHARWHTAAARVFTPKAVARFEEKVRNLAGKYLKPFAATPARLRSRAEEQIAQLLQMRRFRPEASRLTCPILSLQANDGMSLILAPEG